MTNKILYLLIHSPLVGGLTWALVAEQFKQHGLDVRVPLLYDSLHAKEPYWQQHADSISQALAAVPAEQPVILVAHSGAGPLLSAIRQSIANPVRAYVFVDAGIPHDGASRLDLMKLEDPEWAHDFQAFLEAGGHFPNWTSADLSEIMPDENLRDQLVAELRPRGLDFFTEAIPVFKGWPDAPCTYVFFSPPYRTALVEAQAAGWRTYELQAGHFHMLVDPEAVSDLIIKAVDWGK